MTDHGLTVTVDDVALPEDFDAIIDHLKSQAMQCTEYRLQCVGCLGYSERSTLRIAVASFSYDLGWRLGRQGYPLCPTCVKEAV